MITSKQIEQLKEAVKNGTVDQFIKRCEDEIFQSEMNKGGNRAVELTNMRTTVKKTVIGKNVADSFCFHKDAWGGKSYVLSHIKTGVKIFAGKKLTVAGVIKDFIKWEALTEFDAALNKEGIQALRIMNDDHVQQYREFYDRAGN